MRDANPSNPHGEIVIVDVATASIGSVLEVKPYSYLHAVDGLSLKNIKSLCAHLAEAAAKKRNVRLVTRARKWSYMPASKYKLYDVEIQGLKLVGPRVPDESARGG